MGVRGFTTYVSNHSHLFHESFKLKSTYIVIDGSGVAIHLYQWHTRSNDCFGGDYDNYSNTVHNFFALLKKCNVIPVILFDGGYEDRKIKTVFSRMRNRIGAIKRLNSVTEGSVIAFPLFIKELFQEIALELGIKCIRNDYESDSEIACLASNLNCPILGYDSDFYFFDTLYIPFTKFEMKVMDAYNKKLDKHELYIPCEVYKIDKFLKYFGGLDKTNLPLLPVLLGNDYVKKNMFSVFYRHMKLKKSKIENEQQRLIKTVIGWLRHETLESAISKILGRFKTRRRNFISNKLNDAMRGYLQVNSTLTKYLNELEQSSICHKKEYDIDILKIEPTFDVEQMESVSENNLSEVSSGDESEQEVSQLMDQLDVLPTTDHERSYRIDANAEIICFIDKYRNCLLPQCFVDIKMRNTYFCTSQVEDYSEYHSHYISLNILSCIHKMLTQPCIKNLSCISRAAEKTVNKELQPRYSKIVPSFEEIQLLNQEQCKNWCFEILDIDKSFQNLLNHFTPDWHLFFISLYYWKANSRKNIDTSSMYSLIFCSIILNVIDQKIGFCRSSKKLSKVNISKEELKKKKEEFAASEETFMSSSESITYKESVLCLQTMLNYFYMEPKMSTNSRLYDITVISMFSEFQSCFLHIKFLNSIFNFPFSTVSISKFFNGTFLYNLTVNFRKRTNLKSYISLFLRDCPTIVQSFELLIRCLEQWFGEIPPSDVKKVRKRRRKKKRRSE